MNKLTFNFDLTDYDIKEYKKNPIVTFQFDSTRVIGKTTKIDKKKNIIEIELYDDTLGNLIRSGQDLYGIAPGYYPPENKVLEFSIITNRGENYGKKNHEQK